MQEDTLQEPKPQAVPPPLPQVVYVNHVQTKTTRQKWPGALSVVSIVVACTGVLPVLVFMLSCLPSYSLYGGRIAPGLPHYAFFFIGFLLHGIAGIAGFVGMLNGARLAGLLGQIGNAIILLFAVMGLLIGVANI